MSNSRADADLTTTTRANVSITPWRVLSVLFSVDTARRIASEESRDIVRCVWMLLRHDVPPVAVARARDVYTGMRGLDWRGAMWAPRTLASAMTGVLLDSLGASFVKLSQVIAHSPMVAPAVLVRTCKSSLAQCSAPVVPYDEVESLICDQLQIESVEEVFQSLERAPLASASIAQVHGGTLRDGRRVVVKVVRPGVRERLTVDLGVLWLLARVADVLMAPLIAELLSSSAAAMVDEVRVPILAECDLTIERANMLRYRSWLRSSAAVRRAGLDGAVTVPEPVEAACSTAVLTAERIDGEVLSEMRERSRSERSRSERSRSTPATGDATSEAADEAAEASDAPLMPQGAGAAWKTALARALAVQALSVLDDSGVAGAGGLFHADLHAGNMIVCERSSSIAFVDFGVCGSLPPWLRGALLLQALSFVLGDTAYFAEGFAFALRSMPTAAAAPPLDTAALSADLAPLFAELAPINPLRPEADGTIDPALYPLLLRGQLLLHEHGVQLPKEFALLIKTMLFGADYITLFRGEEIGLLSSALGSAAVAYAVSNRREVSRVLQPRAIAKIGAYTTRHQTHAAASLVRDRGRALLGAVWRWMLAAVYHLSPMTTLTTLKRSKTDAWALLFLFVSMAAALVAWLASELGLHGAADAGVGTALMFNVSAGGVQ